MTYQVTTQRIVLGTMERITQNFPTLTAATNFAETVDHTAIVRNLAAVDRDGKPKLVAHFYKGSATGQTQV